MKRDICMLAALLALLLFAPMASADSGDVPVPTDLRWHEDCTWFGTPDAPAAITGMVSWENHDVTGQAYIDLYYRADSSVEWTIVDSSIVECSGARCSSAAFVQETNILENGDYYFTVRYPGGNAVSEPSPVFAYNVPKVYMANSPIYARWRGGEMQWDVEHQAEQDVLGYWVTIRNHTNGKLAEWFFPTQTAPTNLTLPLAERYGDGEYCFQVVAVPADVTQYRSSRGFQSPWHMLRRDGREEDGVAVSVPEPSEWAGAAQAIFAVYDADGRMLGVAQAPENNGHKYVSPAIACDSTGAASGKVFYLNEDGSPACPPETFDF